MSAVYFAKVGDYVKIGFASNRARRAMGIVGSAVKEEHFGMQTHERLAAAQQVAS